MNTRHTVIETDLGPITLAATGDTLTGVRFGRRAQGTGRRAPEIGRRAPETTDPLLDEAAGQLRDYLAGRRHEFDLPLAPEGDAFQHAVWDVVRSIPHGSTTTYGRVAALLGDRRLAQHVGKAVGANPLLVVVPCHRVVGANGSLTGYAGGLTRKRALLEIESPALVMFPGWT